MMKDYPKQLNLSYLKENHEWLIQEAIALNKGYKEFLEQVLALQIEQ